ncbi:MAG TPA: hypothetical protein VF972_12270, partial [Actinomycetota bacterium]
ITLVSRTSSNPAVSCSTDPLSGPGALLSDCVITPTQLGPGDGVTVTIKVHVNSGSSVTAVGTADPQNLVVEFLESNNKITRVVTVVP